MYSASKKTFLSKLSYIFYQVKIGGEYDYLKIKQHKKHNNTYYLLLRIFSYANKFIIEEKDGKIIKISGNKIKKSKEEIEDLSICEIFFGNDERVGFKPSTKYVMNLYRCTNAYEELVNDNIQILTKDDISEWIKKHTVLYEEVKEEYLLFKYNDFRNLFSMLEYLLEELQNYNEAKMALKSFNDSNKTSLNHWLADYQGLAFCNVMAFGSSFRDIDLTEEILKCSFQSNIYFRGDDFL